MTMEGRSASPEPASVPVTVIVSTYNRANLLKEALTSLLSQTIRPRRILVIDDGSTDRTIDVIQGFDGAVDYRAKPNGGKATALNLALSLTDDPLVWIFDDDDLAAPDALELLAQALDERPECGFAYGAYDNFVIDPDTQARKRSSVGIPPIHPDALFPALLERCFVFQGGMLVRRSCYEGVGPFDESLVRSQDYEMLLRLARNFRGAKVDKIVFHQRQHGGSRGTAAQKIKHSEMDEAWRYFDHKIFSRLRSQLDLQDYLPLGTRGREDAETRLAALLQRFVVFARKDLWAAAADDFGAYLSLAEASGKQRLTPAEYGMFSRVFDGFSRGLVSFLGAETFMGKLGAVEPFSLRIEIRSALISPLPYRLRRAIFRRSRTDIVEAVQAIYRLGGPIPVLLWAWRKAFGPRTS